jgi:hypothetical protein
MLGLACYGNRFGLECGEGNHQKSDDAPHRQDATRTPRITFRTQPRHIETSRQSLYTFVYADNLLNFEVVDTRSIESGT